MPALHIPKFQSECMWQADLGQLPNSHQAALTLLLLSTTGGVNKMKKLRVKMRRVRSLICNWEKQIDLEEIKLIYCQLKIEPDDEKQRQN